jgi:hypothetical protein
MAHGGEPTVFELIKEGNRCVGEQSKDRVLEIRSDKSIGGLVPNIWHIVYYDPDAKSGRAEVKFGAGKWGSSATGARSEPMGQWTDSPLIRPAIRAGSGPAHSGTGSSGT